MLSYFEFMSYKYFKRLFDIFFSFFGLIVCLPVLVVTALFVRIFVSSSVFFIQERPGLNCTPFLLVKFRSMLDKSGWNGEILDDTDRLTKFGRILRATSLDELPELWNVLKGDMSLVGPRPLLMEYLPLYSDEQMRRHEVRPGVTGWAQVNGRNAISWDEKFELDVWYVDNQSFLLDIKILLLTINKVFKKEGVSAANHVTMERFIGNDK